MCGGEGQCVRNASERMRTNSVQLTWFLIHYLKMECCDVLNGFELDLTDLYINPKIIHAE